MSAPPCVCGCGEPQVLHLLRIICTVPDYRRLALQREAAYDLMWAELRALTRPLAAFDREISRGWCPDCVTGRRPARGPVFAMRRGLV